MMKRAGHLGARMWFLSAQIDAWLTNDFWLQSAGHANAMAALLETALRDSGLEPLYPVEANMVFVEMTSGQSNALRNTGFLHYFIEQPDGRYAARFVTSHNTSRGEIEALAPAIGVMSR